VQIEEVTPDALRPLVGLMLEMWPESTYDEELADCRKILQADDRTCFLCKMELDYRGFVYLAIRTDYVEGAKRSPVAYLEGIYVQDAFRNQGVGRLLLQAAEKWCRARGFKELASDAEVCNALSVAFHKQMGFQEKNRIVCYVKNLPDLKE
jgi:aminoglycoside 6'-N-acetyltransferase I